MIGTLLGIALALIISRIGIPMPPPPNANVGYTAFIRVVPATVAGAFLVGFFATVLASLWAIKDPIPAFLALAAMVVLMIRVPQRS